MIKFIVCTIGWLLMPLVLVVVGFQVAKTWVEYKLMKGKINV